jgi:hypothetical protein
LYNILLLLKVCHLPDGIVLTEEATRRVKAGKNKGEEDYEVSCSSFDVYLSYWDSILAI